MVGEQKFFTLMMTPSGAGHLISETKVFNEKAIATSSATGSPNRRSSGRGHRYARSQLRHMYEKVQVANDGT
jgi:hypothetical protein